MLNLTDTFIEYLHAEIGGTVPVHWVRVTEDQTTNEPKDGCLNVTILEVAEDGPMEEIFLSLDLIGPNERAVMGWAKVVRDKLVERQYTPEYDYSNPASPVSTGRMVAWDANDQLKFRAIVTKGNYCHLSSTLPVYHAR